MALVAVTVTTPAIIAGSPQPGTPTVQSALVTVAQTTGLVLQSGGPLVPGTALIGQIQGSAGVNIGATAAINFGGIAQENWLVGTLNANLAVTITNAIAGSRAMLLLTQDGTGGRTLTVAGLSVPIAVAAGALTIIEVRCPDASTVDVAVTGSTGTIGVPTAQVFTASNAAVPIPAGATMMQLISVGGGGGGGGAGSAAAAQLQAGASAGGAGQPTQDIAPVGANTTLAFVRGGVGTHGNGGALGGNDGNTGSPGGDTTWTGTGISVIGRGGSPGQKTLASSTVAVGGGIMGQVGGNQNGFGAAGNSAPGGGGGSALSGGDGVGFSGGGGGGGGNASATLGGTGGAAGGTSDGGVKGSNGAAGTSAGTAGGSAAANTGAGGGGGGGGAAGTGAGGNGGDGGTGYGIMITW